MPTVQCPLEHLVQGTVVPMVGKSPPLGSPVGALHEALGGPPLVYWLRWVGIPASRCSSKGQDMAVLGTVLAPPSQPLASKQEVVGLEEGGVSVH